MRFATVHRWEKDAEIDVGENACAVGELVEDDIAASVSSDGII